MDLKILELFGLKKLNFTQCEEMVKEEFDVKRNQT